VTYKGPVCYVSFDAMAKTVVSKHTLGAFC
jgi:hypothetical protein